MGEHKSTVTSVISVDLIRVVAIFAVIVLHAVVYASNDVLIQNNLTVYRGWVVTGYLSFSRIGVPLFLMLTGALLLAPSKKDEDISIFFKKRFIRVGLPFLFWGVIYFLWDIYIENQAVTQEFIIRGILSGPYITFWYLYMLLGLYLVTPLLRVMVANFTNKHFKYFIILWFVGITLTAWIKFVSNGQYQIDGNLFLIPLSVGYFVMGAYFVNIQVKRKILGVFTVLGLALTVIATYLVVWSGGSNMYFFQEYSSFTVILASVSLFMLLNSYGKSFEVYQAEKSSWKHRVLHVISENSLSIYLFHMIALSLIKNGFFGFMLHGRNVDSIIGVPLLVTLTVLLSLIVIIPLKKIPKLKKFIG
ncbi:MAG: acyltransferase [Candidatus Bathyarchaeota archaeon]|nr:acyltransferase [Candidatus Termiticorpusculum sp.]